MNKRELKFKKLKIVYLDNTLDIFTNNTLLYSNDVCALNITGGKEILIYKHAIKKMIVEE